MGKVLNTLLCSFLFPHLHHICAESENAGAVRLKTFPMLFVRFGGKGGGGVPI